MFLKHFVLCLCFFVSYQTILTSGSVIPFEHLICTGDAMKFKNFFRIMADTHDVSEGPFNSMCRLSNYNYNEQKQTSYLLALRMSDTERHYENSEIFSEDDDIVNEYGEEDDYLLVDFGPAKLYITLSHVHIYMKNEKKFSCEVNIFQNENSKDFSTEKFVYINSLISDKGTFSVSTSTKNKWEVCGETKMTYPSSKKLEISAVSEEGINMDILHLEINALKQPWSVKKSTEKVIETTLEHAEERIRVNKNYVETNVIKNMNKIWWIRLHLFVLTLVVCVLICSKCFKSTSAKRVQNKVKSYAYGHDHVL